MSQLIPGHYYTQFKSNIQLLLQQKESKLRGLVTTDTYSGEGARVVDQFGAINMQPVVGRFAPMGRVDASVDSRWVHPLDFDLPQLIDSFDKLRLLTDPASKYIENAVAAANRQIDDLILDAFFADAKTGKTGSTSTAFTAGNIVAHGSTGLTVAKLRAGKKILMANQVDLDSDPLTCVITAEEHDDLLAESQIISVDFNDKPVLVEGRIMRFLGINFVHCERVDFSGSTRYIPLFAKSGMHLGIWNDIETSISKRNDLQGEPWQAYLKMSMGATRLEEKKVIKLECQ